MFRIFLNLNLFVFTKDKNYTLHHHYSSETKHQYCCGEYWDLARIKVENVHRKVCIALRVARGKKKRERERGKEQEMRLCFYNVRRIKWQRVINRGKSVVRTQEEDTSRNKKSHSRTRCVTTLGEGERSVHECARDERQKMRSVKD